MKFLRRLLWTALAVSCLTSACQLASAAESTPTFSPPTFPPIPAQPTDALSDAAFTPAVAAAPSATPIPIVPNFSHIAIIIFENKEFSAVVGNGDMAYFNLLAGAYTLLTQHYATTHPSLPNYISLIGGDTLGITDDCYYADCYLNAPSLPDLIEKSGRTWKTYQEAMPEPCFTGDTLRYVRKHNPFIFFDPIRLDAERCKRSIVPLTQMDADLAANNLPNFIFITPDICYSAHDCDLAVADKWLKKQMDKLYPALDATGEPYLIVLTFDEGQGKHSCCGLPASAGGRVATVLVSPQARTGFQDSIPYSHYSLLKTISQAWGLPYLGHAADAETTLIVAPWK